MNFENVEETYKGQKIKYAGRFNLVQVEGYNEKFTSFEAARKWLDSEENQRKVAAQKIRDKSKA